MSIKYESWFSTILGLSLNSTDTVITLGAVPTVTKGRMYIFDWTQKEWVDFTGVSGVTITWCTRNVSSTADPMTGGTGYNFNAGTPVVLVAMHDQLPDKTTANTFVGNQTITGNVTTSGLLSFTGTDTAWLKIKTLTTTQRDALTPANGMKIYNSTTGTEQTYYGGTWNDAGTNNTPNATEAITGKVRLADQTQVNAGTDTEAGDPLVVIPSTLKSVTDALAANITLVSNIAGLYKQMIYGDGSDGDVTIAGTITLTRDMYYNNLAIPTGTILDPAGYRVFVKGTISGIGTIRRNGNAGSSVALNTATGGAAGAALNQGSLNAEIVWGAGGNGGNNSGGNPWNAWSAANPSLTNINGVAGGAASFSGGTAGASTRGIFYNKTFFPQYVHPATSQTTFGGLNYKSIAGSGGGAGGNAGTLDNAGWGGGAGGNWGLIRIAAYEWNFTGVVSQTGGAGGAGGSTNTGITWGGWGGWGGNGGILFRIYHTLTNDATKTQTWGAGGAWGTGNGGGGNGTAGTTGNAGETISIVF
jgi:hypothetical protein